MLKAQLWTLLKISFIGCLLYTLGSCTTQITSTTDKVIVYQGTNTPSTVEVTMLQMLNSKRAEGAMCVTQSFAAGEALVWNKALSGAAKTHVMDLLRRESEGELDLTATPPPHVDSDGKRVSDRVKQQGYNFSTVAENLASISDDTAQIDATVDNWLNSTLGHCEAMVEPLFNDVGIYFKDGVWAVVFAKAM